MSKKLKVAVAGGGIYGATIALFLRRYGEHDVSLFDPRGIMNATSAINQHRIHAGYHYPRSPETIREILEARTVFLREYSEAVVQNTRHYYLVAREGSKVTSTRYENILDEFELPYVRKTPPWVNGDFIEGAYEVREQLYDPVIMRGLLIQRLTSAGVSFYREQFVDKMRDRFDVVVYATYGAVPNNMNLNQKVRFQIAEKILISLPSTLKGQSVVVIDGPFTGFDPYRTPDQFLFGSARYTNHWTSEDLTVEVPEPYKSLVYKKCFEPVDFTHFEDMVQDGARAVPMLRQAKYHGSRFTIRVIEDSPEDDRRVLRITQPRPGEYHVFSAKVVGAVKAAKILAERVLDYA